MAELIGTAFLSMAVIGSGIAASRLSPGDAGLQLLENSVATGAALVALIAAFQSVSSAFNPVVTLLDVVFKRDDWRSGILLVTAQVVGAVLGALVADIMFGRRALSLSTDDRGGLAVMLAEAVATLGLLLVVFGLIESRRTRALPYAVGSYIVAAYWFTSSTSFANPALTIARTLSDTFAGIDPASAARFLIAQGVGALVACGVLGTIWPRRHRFATNASDAE